MEVKKSPKADLEGKKSTWLLIGYVFILALMFVAFEWTDRDKQVTTETGITDVVFEEEIIPITEQEQKQAPPPPEAPKVEEVLQIVENDAKVEETAIQASEETGQAVEVKYVPVEVEEEEPEEQQIFQVVEEMPEFPGGMAECLKFLGKNIKYPTISQENGVQGKVIVQFVVNKDIVKYKARTRTVIPAHDRVINAQTQQAGKANNKIPEPSGLQIIKKKQQENVDAQHLQTIKPDTIQGSIRKLLNPPDKIIQHFQQESDCSRHNKLNGRQWSQKKHKNGSIQSYSHQRYDY